MSLAPILSCVEITSGPPDGEIAEERVERHMDHRSCQNMSFQLAGCESEFCVRAEMAYRINQPLMWCPPSKEETTVDHIQSSSQNGCWTEKPEPEDSHIWHILGRVDTGGTEEDPIVGYGSIFIGEYDELTQTGFAFIVYEKADAFISSVLPRDNPCAIISNSAVKALCRIWV